MNTRFIKLVCLTASLFYGLTTPAYAGDVNPYINAGVGLLDDQSRDDFNGHITGLIRGGVELNRYFAFEAEGQIGFGEREEVFTSSPERFDEFQTSIDYQVAVFAVGKIPLSDALSLHGRVGYGFYQSSTSADQFFEGENRGTIEDTIKHNGGIFGLGGQYLFGVDKINGIRFDASLLIDPDNEGEDEGGLPAADTVPGFTVAYVRKF